MHRPPATPTHKQSANLPPDEFIKGFQVFDKAGNGFIGAGELRYVLTQLGEKMTDAEVDELLKGFPVQCVFCSPVLLYCCCCFRGRGNVQRGLSWGRGDYATMGRGAKVSNEGSGGPGHTRRNMQKG